MRDHEIGAEAKSSRKRRENPLAPSVHVQNLTGACWRILRELFFLHECYALAHPGEDPYSWCSQEYLALKVGCTREWVSRCTTWLHRQGFITKTRRRPIRGRRRTCMYRLASACNWRIRRFLNLLSVFPNHVKNTARKATTYVEANLTSRAPRAIEAAAPP